MLRALFYALLIHLVWSWWTWRLVQDLAGGHWQHHLIEVVTWAIVVLVLSPILVGVPLNHVLRNAESKGALSWWHYALGGRDARDAWDVVFQRATIDGAWVLVHLKGDEPASPRIVLGKYGKHSVAGQSPAERKIREGALQPDKDPSASPPGPAGSRPINPITGRPMTSPNLMI